jgi:isopentenyl diphosphate isomerase/L-lactate dehydrogenase-like FMN-dependent dehydrogenase
MQSSNRREFLRFLAASPLAAQAFGQTAPSGPADVLSVAEFEALTRAKLPPAHLGYLLTGVDDDLTLAANRQGFQKWDLRARRLVDVSKTDIRTEILGTPWDSPIFLCPVGGQGAFHPEGEVAVARAAKAKKHVQILSTVTSHSVEEVRDALGTAPWYQLYMPTTWDATERMVRRVEEAGCPVMAWTIDLLGGRNTETATRGARQDTRDCMSCHINGLGSFAHRPMFKGIDVGINPREANWSYVERLKKMTRMKLAIKGIDSAADARLCRESGADAIIVSNHGGRATETLRSTIETLPEILDAVGNRIPVMIDGGFRRGTDIFKALALGARAVGVGRPYIFGLSAFGQAGVERILDILRAELALTMRQCGTPTLKDITPASVGKRA